MYNKIYRFTLVAAAYNQRGKDNYPNGNLLIQIVSVHRIDVLTKIVNRDERI
jgi:hypothetical protein